MTASVPNVTPPNPAGLGKAASAAAPNAVLGVFDSMLNTAGPPGLANAPGQAQANGALEKLQSAIAGLAGQPAAAADGKTEKTEKAEKTGKAEAATTATDSDATDDAAADLLAGLEAAVLGGQAPTNIAAPEAKDAHPEEAQAYGRDKPKGAPAAPALANANANARLAEKAGLEDAAALTQDQSAVVDEPSDAPPKTPGPHPAAQAIAHAAPGSRVAQAAATLQTPAPAPVEEPAAVTPPPTLDAEGLGAAAEEPPAPGPAPAAIAAAARQPIPALSKPTPGPKSERGKAGGDTPSGGPEILSAAKKPGTAQAASDTAAAPTAAETETSDVKVQQAADAPDSATPAAQEAGAPASTAAGASHAAAHPVRGAPETLAHLAAQIVKKLEGRSTRFDVELQPAGLGKVDVRIEIGAQGQLTAAMTFDNQGAAADLRARASDLQRALEQAGFDLSGGLSFDVAGERGQSGQGWGEAGGDTPRGFRGQAFQAALDNAGQALDQALSNGLHLRRGVRSGVDVRI